ncbi:MAG TPA: hypothetical protein VI789_03800 [Dehalococcoidia bacterium]|nr:hypothetical protein [Dehalococcoidia bacterium]
MTTSESSQSQRQRGPRPRVTASVRPIEPSQMATVMRETSGPFGVDNSVRNAISTCWRTFPENDRSPERVEAEVLRIVRRALDDFKADAAAFGF